VRQIAAIMLSLPLLLPLSACERAMQDMYDQPRGKAYGASELFSDGAASRTPPEGTVIYARGSLAGSSSGRQGAEQARQSRRTASSQEQPYPVDMALLIRGRERFDIYCMPCHSPLGDGDGRVARRGFPSPPTYHSDRLRHVSDRYIFDVMTNGYGVMASYADRVTPADRWAIVAYVRALQLSQHAQIDQLPDEIAGKAYRALSASAGVTPRTSSGTRKSKPGIPVNAATGGKAAANSRTPGTEGMP